MESRRIGIGVPWIVLDGYAVKQPDFRGGEVIAAVDAHVVTYRK
jgi:hypothetical protein